MDKNIITYASQMSGIIDKILFLEKNNVLIYGDDLKLYPSEIHLILLIGRNQSPISKNIAKMLGITKGAVSQTVSRLVKKGIIEKKKTTKKRMNYPSFSPLWERRFNGNAKSTAPFSMINLSLILHPYHQWIRQ